MRNKGGCPAWLLRPGFSSRPTERKCCFLSHFDAGVNSYNKGDWAAWHCSWRRQKAPARRFCQLPFGREGAGLWGNNRPVIAGGVIGGIGVGKFKRGAVGVERSPSHKVGRGL